MTTVENKVPSVNNLVKQTDFNTKVTEIEGNISGLATKTELTAVEIKIPSVSNLVKKSKITGIEKKIDEHKHDQYIITQEFNESTAKNVARRIKLKRKFSEETYFDTKLTSFNKRINWNKTKQSFITNEVKRKKTFDLSYFRDKLFWQRWFSKCVCLSTNS